MQHSSSIQNTLPPLSNEGYSLNQGWDPPEAPMLKKHTGTNGVGSGDNTRPSVDFLADEMLHLRLERPAPRKAMRQAIRDFTNNKIQTALRELELGRQRRATQLLADVAQRANEKTGAPLPPFACLLDYTKSYGGQFRTYANRLCEQYRRAFFLPSIYSVLAEPDVRMSGTTGDEVLRTLRHVYASFPEPPTPFQWKIFEAMCCAASALIYGQEKSQDPNWVLERNNWVEDDGIVGILTGRKTGKSTALAMCHLTFMMVIRGYRGVNASRTLEQAVIIIDLARQLVRRHPHMKLAGLRVEQVRQRFLSIVSADGSWSSSLEAKCGDGAVRRKKKKISLFVCLFSLGRTGKYYILVVSFLLLHTVNERSRTNG
jgi:hypothetical protein